MRQESPRPLTPMANVVRSTANLQIAPESISWKSDAWRAFGAALKALETAVGVFPPLKKAVSGWLVHAIHLRIAEDNQAEYDQIALDLADLAQTIQTHLPESKPRWMPYSIENAARSIGEQVVHIKQQQDRSTIGQVVRASDGETDILRCYRRVEHVFRGLQIDISLSIWDLTHEKWMDTKLKDLTPVREARYNGALSMEISRHGCTPGTHVKILDEAMHWTRNLDAAKIYWMNRMAGTGRTTIAYSLCERLEESEQLGACFFCSRSLPDCRDVNRIVPTIAYTMDPVAADYTQFSCGYVYFPQICAGID
ncbi:unnamed protein product [Rhizoctonia solani]|uniref:Nephrocystin 3-like N-terminal domain-containing protein n=1 Tax=Rhizoctonia solani TaxID=456999 RepID=A0A8H3GEF0_9AGAM|nr:unnamed protein product [Rhizoctonia solani]